MPNLLCVCVLSFVLVVDPHCPKQRLPPSTVDSHGGRAGLTCSEDPRARSIFWAPVCLLHRQFDWW